MKAEIISIGTELLLGEIIDTNSSYLADQLAQLGIELLWVTQAGDNQPRLTEALDQAWQRSDLILVSGGLGPTGDDLTREAIAGMLQEEMEVSPPVENKLRERFARWGVDMPQSNLKQATLIPSATSIHNELGSASGWWVERDGRILVAMPGPPRELKEMWQKDIRPRLSQGSSSITLPKVFKTFGLSEAAVGELIEPLISSENPIFGVYAKEDGIQVRIAARAESKEKAELLIAESESTIRGVLGEYIWGVDDNTLESVVGKLLVKKGLSLAVMEDYSGGWLTAGITDVPESRQFFKGGLVAPSDEVKISFGVNADVISKHGSVSPEVARVMAEAASEFYNADLGVGITGIKETKSEPMGVVYIGINDGSRARAINLPRGKRRVTASALFELRKSLISNNQA